jgi:glycosyltransferase involved in cell wall biosynthesis
VPISSLQGLLWIVLMNKVVAKCTVVHSGARDHYRLAKALNDAGYLENLVTDFYFPGWAYRMIPSIAAKRYCEGLPFSRIKMSAEAFYYSLRTSVGNNFNWNNRKDQALSEKAFEQINYKHSHLFCYSYYAYYAFKKIDEKALPQKKILFQLHPHPVSIRKLLLEEIDRVPAARESIMYENEMRYSEEYLYNLSQESSLADKILVASSYTKKTLIENGISEHKITVTPYGVKINSAASNICVKSDDVFRFIYVGSMIQRKGIYYLLEAFKKVKSKKVELVLCGRGFIDKALLDEYYSDTIIIKKDLTNEELFKELKRANVFVLPSLSEGFAHVILEAMAAGLPVITTPHTCGPDIIDEGENGFIVPIRNVEKLKEKIEWCIENQESITNMGHAAENKARQYTWKRFEENVVSFYEKICQS